MSASKFNGFLFNGPRLEDFDLPRVGHSIGVGEDIIHAVMDVEAAGKSTDSKGRLKALYEPHVAYRNAKGAIRNKLAAKGLAYPKWKKGYPKDSYPRIEAAMAIDETVALLATSWGFPQILGENYATAGYASVQEMVRDFQKDEDNQLEAMIRFIKGAKLDDELRVLEAKLKRGEKITADDCRAFVRGYNGSRYAENNYHTKFAKALNKWAKIKDTPWSPEIDPEMQQTPVEDVVVAAAPVNDPVIVEDEFGPHLYDGKKHEIVERAQEQLDRLGYPEVGAFDGRWGTRTRTAVLAFRADNGLPITPTLDKDFMAALLMAKPRPQAPERANATLDDLRKEDAEDVKAADTTQIVGGIAGAGGLLGAVTKATETFESYGGLMERWTKTIAPVQEFLSDNFWIILIVVGGVVVWKTDALKRIRLKKHQTGNDVSV